MKRQITTGTIWKDAKKESPEDGQKVLLRVDFWSIEPQLIQAKYYEDEESAYFYVESLGVELEKNKSTRCERGELGDFVYFPVREYREDAVSESMLLLQWTDLFNEQGQKLW